MTVSKDTLERDAETTFEVERTRYGHDPLDPPDLHWGELLDADWEEEFDRRLAAWQSESPAIEPEFATHPTH